MFAPLLPAVGCLALLLIFQTKYFLAMFLLSPPRVRFSAQRTSTLAYFLLLGRFLRVAYVQADVFLLHWTIALWCCKKKRNSMLPCNNHMMHRRIDQASSMCFFHKEALPDISHINSLLRSAKAQPGWMLMSPSFCHAWATTGPHWVFAGALVLCSVPLVFNMTWQRDRCGPNQGTSMRAALAAGIASSPR